MKRVTLTGFSPHVEEVQVLLSDRGWATNDGATGPLRVNTVIAWPTPQHRSVHDGMSAAQESLASGWAHWHTETRHSLCAGYACSLNVSVARPLGSVLTTYVYGNTWAECVEKALRETPDAVLPEVEL